MPGDPLAMSRRSPNLDPFPVFSSSAWSGKELSMTFRGAEWKCKQGTFDQVPELADAAPGRAAASAGARAGGKQQGERRALAQAALRADAAVMGLDDIAANRQAQAGAAQARRVGAGLGREEGLEDAPQVLRRDADAVIGHAELGKPP